MKILDCTLRDGSYAINFQFTRDQTSIICKDLENCKIPYIEIGHGVGLGASKSGHGIACESDEIYMQTANETLSSAMWGMFSIPGISKKDDYYKASDYMMKFIRIGIDPNNFDQSKEYINLAKKLNFFTCVNFMKSYNIDPKRFSEYALEVSKLGGDVVYIVDSAGSMLPDQISKYINEIKDKSDKIKIGFHGHDNLGLATANSLKAFELGADIIDASLLGIGRGAGNTSIEKFVCTLLKVGVDLDIDPIKLMDVAEKHFEILNVNNGIDSIDIISGLSSFHSSYMNIIEKYANKYQVDPRKLIISVCNHNQIDVPIDLVEREAKKLTYLGKDGNWKNLYKKYFGSEQN